MLKNHVVAGVLALFAAAPALTQPAPAAPAATPAAQSVPASSPAAMFGVRESVEQIDISPDGRHVVYLQPGPGRVTIVFVSDLAGNAAPRVVVRSDGNPERIRSCNFVTNERLICQISGMATIAGILTPFSRLVSLDTTGQNVRMLGQRESFYDSRLRQFDGEILDWLVGQDGQVLMTRDYVPEEGRIGTRMVRRVDGRGVDRIDVRTLRSTTVEPPNRAAGWYLSDGRGVVRVMAAPQTRSGTGAQLSNQVDYFYRAAGSHDWHRLGSSGTRAADDMVPLAVDPTLNAAYILRELNGREALYRIKLDGTMATELVYANEHVDVDDVIRASHGSRVIGVTFAEEQRRVVYFDTEYAALARSLGRAIPNLPLIDFGSASTDGNQLLVHASSDSDPGRFYVYDRTGRNLNEILMVRPELENVALASVRAVTYPAADGVSVPAYLTLPPGSNGRNLPTVILPHGGPTARDEGNFDWIAQYLAHQGYAVLQPNYRGSAGYGDQWLQQNGFTGWRTSISDITAGARWLIQQGIADGNRMGIVGWSYGGYAALQAGVAEPRMFKAIVAIAPVTDLQQAKDDMRDYTSARNVADFIGTGPHIREGSPLQNVAAIQAPVLLFHGDRDLNVRVVHSQHMDEALRGAGKRSELVLFPGLEHDLADSGVRVQMLQRMGDFLAAQLGGH
jgi:dipeptidyl aminopeptidase/acylaminoacyl peptidase